MLRRLGSALATLVVLTVGACDSAEPGPTGRPGRPGRPGPSSAAPAVLDGVAALYAGDDPAPEERDEAACFADALLARLDPDELAAAGIVVEGAVAPVLPVLDEPTARTWVAAQARASTSSTSRPAPSAPRARAGSTPRRTPAACATALTADEVDAALVNTLTGRFDTPEVAALGRAQADCARAASPPD